MIFVTYLAVIVDTFHLCFKLNGFCVCVLANGMLSSEAKEKIKLQYMLYIPYIYYFLKVLQRTAEGTDFTAQSYLTPQVQV